MTDGRRRNPFPGPAPYSSTYPQPEERSALAADITSAIEGNSSIRIIHGPSGAGKTSLLQTSVKRLLKEDGWDLFSVNRWSLPPESEAGAPADDSLIRLDKLIDDQLEALRASETRSKPSKKTAVLFDQLEQLFQQNLLDTALDSVMDRLISMKTDAADESTLVIFGIREDYLGRLFERLRNRTSALWRTVRVPHLTHHQMRLTACNAVPHWTSDPSLDKQLAVAHLSSWGSGDSREINGVVAQMICFERFENRNLCTESYTGEEVLRFYVQRFFSNSPSTTADAAVAARLHAELLAILREHLILGGNRACCSAQRLNKEVARIHAKKEFERICEHGLILLEKVGDSDIYVLSHDSLCAVLEREYLAQQSTVQLKAQYQQQLQTIQDVARVFDAASAERLRMLMMNQDREREALLSRHQQQLKDVGGLLQRAKDQLQNAHTQAERKLREEYAAQLGLKQEDLDRQARQHTVEIRRLTESHHAESERLSRQYTATLGLLHSSHTKSLSDLEAHYKQEMRSQEDRLDALRSDFEKWLASANQARAEEAQQSGLMLRMAIFYEDEKRRNLQEQHLRECVGLREQHSAEVRMLVERHEQELNALSHKYREELSVAEQQRRDELASSSSRWIWRLGASAAGAALLLGGAAAAYRQQARALQQSEAKASGTSAQLAQSAQDASARQAALRLTTAATFMSRSRSERRAVGEVPSASEVNQAASLLLEVDTSLRDTAWAQTARLIMRQAQVAVYAGDKKPLDRLLYVHNPQDKQDKQTLCVMRAAADGSGHQAVVLDEWMATPTSLLMPSACSSPTADAVYDAVTRSKSRDLSPLPSRKQFSKGLIPASLDKSLRGSLVDALLPCGPRLVVKLPSPWSKELLVASLTGLLLLRADSIDKVQKGRLRCSDIEQVDPARPDIEFVSVSARGEFAFVVVDGRFAVYPLSHEAGTLPLPWQLDLVGDARDAAWGPKPGQLATISGGSVQIWDFSAASMLDLGKLHLFATSCIPEAGRMKRLGEDRVQARAGYERCAQRLAKGVR